MNLVRQWLSAIGLEYAIPKFEEHSVNSPQTLSQVTLRDMYEKFGIRSIEDRKNLFYLIERLRLTMQISDNEEDLENVEPEQKPTAPPPKPVNSPLPTPPAPVKESMPKSAKKHTPIVHVDKNSAVKPKIASPSQETANSLISIKSRKRVASRQVSPPPPPPADPPKPLVVANPSITPRVIPLNEIAVARKRDASPIHHINVPTNEPVNPSPRLNLTIRVVVRKRPLSAVELSSGETDIMNVESERMLVVNEEKLKVDLSKCVEVHRFAYDNVFDSDKSNQYVYQKCVRPLVYDIFHGGRATCFAFGQTGSGKTYTMLGNSDESNPGIYMLTAKDIFLKLLEENFDHVGITVSCYEIYGGKLFDLLNDRSAVRCLEDAKQKVQIVGLSQHDVEDYTSLMVLMARANRIRSIGSTGVNDVSSRSHAIFDIVLKDISSPREEEIGRMTFIDLAGSERGSDTRHADKQTRLEGAEINTSLLALKEVIRSLEKKHGYTPFRGSKLTQVLKDSFIGDNTRTVMIACVSPGLGNAEHSLNSLRYADRVKEYCSEDHTSVEPQESVDSDNKVRRRSLSSGANRVHKASPDRQIEKNDNSKIPAAIELPQPLDAQVASPRRVARRTELSRSRSTASTRTTTTTEKESLTSDLLVSEHKKAITAMVNLMKEEMSLVHSMDVSRETRDFGSYTSQLDRILEQKRQAISSLREQLKSYRRSNKVSKEAVL